MRLSQIWQQEQYINKGGYSQVFRVKRDGKYYALKKIFPHLVKNYMHREAIQREISIMQSLDHPKIIKLHHAIIQEDQINLLLEYAEGGSVYDQLKNYGKLPQHKAKQYLKDVIEAIDYLHTRPNPILHRDIKPQNLLICENNHCKLADFGAANYLQGTRLSYRGTEEYMAPEVIGNQPHGMPYDIWCLGILIHELLTGEMPKQKKPYPDYLSRAAEDVIKKLLVVDQQQRMTLQQLKQHIWLCQDKLKIVKVMSSQKIDKMECMKRRLRQKIEEKKYVWKDNQLSSHMFKKEKSTLEENEELNQKNQVFINMLKARQKIKEEIMKNQHIIQIKERRRKSERPYLLQEIDRLKCSIKQYENNINTLKAHPLKKQAECKHCIRQMGKRISDLTQYVKQFPSRIKSDLFHFCYNEVQIQSIPVSQYLYKRKTQMLQLRRDSLIELIDAKNKCKRVKEMLELNTQVHYDSQVSMSQILEQKMEDSLSSRVQLRSGLQKKQKMVESLSSSVQLRSGLQKKEKTL